MKVNSVNPLLVISWSDDYPLYKSRLCRIATVLNNQQSPNQPYTIHKTNIKENVKLQNTVKIKTYT